MQCGNLPSNDLQVEELCEAANAQVDAKDRVRIANFLCNGNYAVSGGIPGCEVVERIAKPDFKVSRLSSLASDCSALSSLLLFSCDDAC